MLLSLIFQTDKKLPEQNSATFLKISPPVLSNETCYRGKIFTWRHITHIAKLVYSLEPQKSPKQNNPQ